MFYYKDYISLNSKFNKSTNIIYDKQDCSNYIITTSARSVLKLLFKLNYHNSIALIGPFGCGKSSLLLYINTLLSNNSLCLNKLKKVDSELYREFETFFKSKKFLEIKIVGEHTSFKEQFKNTILSLKGFDNTIKYLNENREYQLSKTLEYLNSDILNSEYTDTIFSIDEFGKFIEYGFDNINSNDIFDLQTLSEFVNKQKNYKLIISLHKSFNEYAKGTLHSDWDKIQGRFESVVFKDDYYEMLNIFKETISLKNSIHIDKSKEVIEEICSDESFKKIINSSNLEELFKKIIPIHPYALLVIVEIFSKYFQNQRSIYSFIFSAEPNAFQEFINKKFQKYELYSLSNLYDYLSYLQRVYSISLPDREIWYLSEYKLRDYKIKNEIQRDIIKTIALIHTFKLANVILPNREHIILSLADKYEKKDLEENIKDLKENGFLIFQEQSKSFSLLEDSNIDINRELKNILSKNLNIDYEKKINSFIDDKYTIAKRFFINYGNKKVFEKVYISNTLTSLNQPYKIFLIDRVDKKVKEYILKSKKSIFILLNNRVKIDELIQKIEALKIIQNENRDKISTTTNSIIEDMILDYKLALEELLKESYQNIYFESRKYEYNLKNIQNLISSIAEKNYSQTPIFNNYTLSHTIFNQATNTLIIRKLFESLLNDFDKEDLGIDKYPAHKALYLSIIKPAKIHKKIGDNFKLCKPTDLNFEYIWKYISSYLSKRVRVRDLLNQLQKEPFGLNKTNALFVISLFIVVNRNSINIFRENSYKYELSIDLLINMWKADEKFELHLIKLTNEQKELFKAYIQITTDISDYEYSKDKIVSIIKVLYTKFSALPDYAKSTQKISKEAIALRSVLNSMKEPTEAFFEMFPKALGYEDIALIDKKEFIVKFKSAFNEIALSFKRELSSLEKYIANIFYFNSNLFPYDNGLIELTNKLSNIDRFDSEIKALIQSFIYSNSILELIDSMSVILIGKKFQKCYDNDINELREKLLKSSKKIFEKLELKDIAKEDRETYKLSISSLDTNLNRVISIKKNEVNEIQEEAKRVKNQIPKSYSREQKLYLITKLLNEELKDE